MSESCVTSDGVQWQRAYTVLWLVVLPGAPWSKAIVLQGSDTSQLGGFNSVLGSSSALSVSCFEWQCGNLAVWAPLHRSCWASMFKLSIPRWEN